MKTRWSVVITTRNRAKMLGRAIKSCLDQTAPPEIVVVDEASNDQTQEVVKGVPNLKYIRNPQAVGHSAAANIGIREADADWIKPLDDDDWLAPNCIESMNDAVASAKAKNLNPVLVSGRVINVDQNEQETSRSRPLSDVRAALKSHDLLELMMVDQAPLGTPVQVGHSREAALTAGGWNEHRTFHHQHGDEVEFWVRLGAIGDAIFIPNIIGYRTLWAGGSQDLIPPKERYYSNVFLKKKIAEQLEKEVSQDIRSYLALHWALVATKNRAYAQALNLGLKWMRSPASLVHIINQRTLKDAHKRLVPA
jgi:glycosyltransferase involved in cell wall biosynthesis